jgi:hypothetical protein
MGLGINGDFLFNVVQRAALRISMMA